jgi:excisionase family DNA binding protein
VSEITFTIAGFEEMIRRVVREELDGREARDEWFGSRGAADYLGISLGHLYNLKGNVPSHKVGGRRRYRRSELDAYQESH